MKIWIDITNAPHVHLFKNVVRTLQEKGYQTLITARDFGPLHNLLTQEKIPHHLIGKHGGANPHNKLVESSKRILALAKLIKKYKPDIVIAKHSVEAPRVGFGLNIPVLLIVDNEHATAQNRLTLPLATRIITPKPVPIEKLVENGADPQKIRRFNGLLELAHILNTNIKEIHQELGLDPELPTLTIRPEPFLAHYYPKTVQSRLIPLLKHLTQNGENNIVVLPRNLEQQKTLEKLFGDKVVIPNRPADGPSLLAHSSLMIGGGGTMNREAALLGTPNISFYPGPLPGVSQYLVEKELIHHTTNMLEIITKSESLPETKNQKQEIAKNLVAEMENPVKIVLEEIERIITTFSS
ncbi:MAG: hypothetical protein DRO11_03095 [Methanobacteriota archaeon]|nr:MAG: hypothetical protein DRO11_03095 [Euryarchaeota archaeon]